jgi:hypothetical protein
MACENFEASDDHPNKCKNCGEFVSAHLDFSGGTDDDGN